VPLDALHCPTWVLAHVQQWPGFPAAENPSPGGLLDALHRLAAERPHGVLVGSGDGVAALLFIYRNRICGAQFEPGDLHGREALVQVREACERMSWTFRAAPERFGELVPIMASLVGDGGHQLVRLVGPTMSAHLEALAEVERNSLAYLIVRPSGTPDAVWIVFSDDEGSAHRLLAGGAHAGAPSLSKLDAGGLMAILPKHKADDDLHVAEPRFFSEAPLAPGAALAPERPFAEPAAVAPGRGRSPLIYLVPTALALLAVGTWTIWRVGQAPEKPQVRPLPAIPAQPPPIDAHTDSELAASRARIEGLQREIALLRQEMNAVRRQAPAAPTQRGAERQLTPAQARRREDNRVRMDSLMNRVAYLEDMLAQSRAAHDQTVTPEQVVQPPPPSPPATATAPSPTPAPEGTGSGTAQAEPVQARAYTETLVDQPPEIVESGAVRYPAVARRLGIGGQVLLSVLVAADGTAQQVIPLRGHEYLRQAAIDGVRSWRFRPARQRGAPVACWKTVVIDFRP